MGLYVSQQMVMNRLEGKIRFTDDPETYPDKMSFNLLRDLINQAEGDVELDLSIRYAAPFQTIEGAAFMSLPERPTKQVLRNLCVMKAVMKCLSTDFGRGSSVKGSNYYDDLKNDYESLLKRQTELKPNTFNTFLYPPLPGLMLNYQNEMADTGFKGRILTVNADAESGDFAGNQINAPDRTFWNPDPRDFNDVGANEGQE